MSPTLDAPCARSGRRRDQHSDREERHTLETSTEMRLPPICPARAAGCAGSGNQDHGGLARISASVPDLSRGGVCQWRAGGANDC